MPKYHSSVEAWQSWQSWHFRRQKVQYKYRAYTPIEQVRLNYEYTATITHGQDSLLPADRFATEESKSEEKEKKREK